MSDPEPMLTQETLSRLAFVRYLYLKGVEETRRPEPYNAAGLLTLHDAVEFLLDAAVEHRGGKGRNRQFMEYWNLLRDAAQPVDLTHEQSMRRLNQARVDLKHHGIRPSAIDVEAFRAAATEFLVNNTLTVFGVPFERVSLVELVSPQDVRDRLRQAEAAIADGRLDEAMEQTAIAFELALKCYRSERWAWIPERQRFALVTSPLLRDFRTRVPGANRFRDFDEIHTMLEALREGLELSFLGIDYERWVAYRQFWPAVFMAQGRDEPVLMKGPGQASPTSELATEVVAFVVEVSLRLQERLRQRPTGT